MYDFVNNRGAIYTSSMGTNSALLYNFQNFEAYSIKGETAFEVL